ncbi:hypothetical protein ACFO3D_12970 [Virgibacillus kekensis]|uniref:Uncharacterized protein n=1 Tax=Virgibacillus kekensis TaxID=202261 RepID=A0ABV9DLZ3_9BACI
MGTFIRNCRLCKKPMESSPFMMCPTCLVESDRVRSFVAKCPKVSVEEIASATNVEKEKVENMVNLGFKNKDDVETGVR